MTTTPPPLWFLKNYTVTLRPDGITLIADTNILVDLLLLASFYLPKVRRIPQIRRGAYIHDSIRYTFRNPALYLQHESGLTLEHTFFIPITAPNTIVYLSFLANSLTARLPGSSGYYRYAFKGAPMYVISLARLGDPPGAVLHGEVRLEEGDNITILRIPATNSLKLSAPNLIGGSGTDTRIPRFSSPNTIAATPITESELTLTVDSAFPATHNHSPANGYPVLNPDAVPWSALPTTPMDLTASRAINTVYQNLYGSPMLLIVSIRLPPGDIAILLIEHPIPPPSIGVCSVFNANPTYHSDFVLTALVPTSWHYKLTSISGAPHLWHECKIGQT